MAETILVTGIGGNVGQGIVRILRDVYPTVKVIGTNVKRVSAGNFLCDAVYEVPYAYDSGYVDAMQKICLRECIDLILPATDYESFYLATDSKLKEKTPGPAADIVSIFLDKYKTWQEFSKRGIPFADSVLPEKYHGHWSKNIAKPREGRGSRGIRMDVRSAVDLDDTYMIQPRLEGDEITSAFYANKNGALLGQLTLHRTLDNGTTVACSVTREFEESVSSIGRSICEHFAMQGCFNVQSIVTKDGPIPFEVNCRISGTASIRHCLGFKDVQYLVDEHLFGKILSQTPSISEGSAVRILMDVVYPNNSLKQIGSKTDDFRIF